MKKLYDTLKTVNGNSLAYIYDYSAKNKHNLVWFGGLNSDMYGTKAEAISEYASLNNLNFCRFDYSGHGLSSGNFEDFNISDWLNDSISILDNICKGQQIFIGSSMGGWISLLLALKRKKRVNGLVLIAPAVDMTEILMWNNFSNKEKELLEEKGYIEIFSDDYPSYKITKNIINDGRNHLIMNEQITLECPVNIIHGMEDDAVPWGLSMELSKKISSNSITQSYIKDGDHALSRLSDLDNIFFSIEQIIKKT